jgi:hypothetical protein
MLRSSGGFDAASQSVGAQLIATPSLRDLHASACRLISVAAMENFEFIQERQEESFMRVGVLTGWETVVFQVEDVPPED